MRKSMFTSGCLAVASSSLLLLILMETALAGGASGVPAVVNNDGRAAAASSAPARKTILEFDESNYKQLMEKHEWIILLMYTPCT
jgi:hypothetical protein